MTLLRTKRPFTVPPGESPELYAYNIPLTNITVTEDHIIGDVPHEPVFRTNNKNIWPKGVWYPKYAWEKVG